MLRIEIAKLPAESVAAPVPEIAAAPSPFAYRARRAGPVDEAENPALAEYNRMLAALAAQDLAGQDHESQQQEGR